MSDPATFQLVIAGLQAIPALLWAVITWTLWRFLRRRRPNLAAYHVLVAVAALLAWHYGLWTLAPVVPAHLRGERNLARGVLFAAIDGGVIALMATGRHFVLVWPLRGEPPRGSWLAVNYGLAAAVGVVLMLCDLHRLPLPSFFAAFTTYILTMGALTVRDVRRLARRAPWRAGGLGDLGTPDAVFTVLGLGCIVAAHLLPVLGGTTTLALTTSGAPSGIGLAAFALHALAGVVLAVPFVVRDLGDIVRGFAIALVTLGTTTAGLVGGRALGARVADAELRRLLDAGIVLAVVLVVWAARGWLATAVDRVLLRRRRNRWAELHETLQTFSPELGVLESCRRALAAVADALQLRGAAILLADGQTVVHGTLAMDALRDAWPRGGPEALPNGSLGIARFRLLPRALREVLVEANVNAVVPIVSPRRHWGHVFVATSVLGASFAEEDDHGVNVAANQVALLLDGADLLARAVAVERSLAHAEKLAAIGELVARVAHDIRNPVTAARSLAQQLASEAGAPFAAEHTLILEELGRVERQVAALLRFARREELALEPLDLGALARDTMAALRPRLDGTGVRVVLETAAGVTTRGDRERLRQVLINLVENACDAMAAGPSAPRALTVAVTNGGGAGVVRVADTGPGIPADALPHLFEPFYSTKLSGTGLGLAIARRTVEAHGGRITAYATDPGMVFEIELPLVP